jgi:hypothetical protein
MQSAWTGRRRHQLAACGPPARVTLGIHLTHADPSLLRTHRAQLLPANLGGSSEPRPVQQVWAEIRAARAREEASAAAGSECGGEYADCSGGYDVLVDANVMAMDVGKEVEAALMRSDAATVCA